MLGQFIFWVFVMMLGIEIGAGVYEQIVVVPLWASNAPDSVIAYYQHNVAHPELAMHAGPRFWMFFTPTLGVMALAAFISGIWTRPEHRKWRMAGAGLSLVVIIATFGWFVPNIMKLGSADVLTMNRDEVARIANSWANLNWVRAATAIVAWVLALRAFSISSKPIAP